MKRIKNLSRRGLALLMTLTMCLSLLPATAMAEDVVHDPSTHTTKNGWTCVKGDLLCAKESHGHGAGCYGEAPLTCDISEAHEHTDECYNADRELICGYLTAHAHTDECYKTEEVLVCQAEEHKHTEDCYDAEGSLTCKLHEHTDACYETRRGEQLICDLEEIKAHEHGTACYGEAPLTCQLEEHEHTDGCYAWTCTYTKPVQEIPAEVRAFVKAVEALPEAEEITVENAVDVGEQIQALEDVSYVAEDYMDDEEVYTACLKYMDVSYAVTQALELVGETYYDVNGDDWWYHGNGNGSFGVENLNEAIQNSNGEFIIYIKADSAVTFDRSVVIPDNKTVKVYNYGTNRTIQRNGDYPLFVVKGGGTLLIGGDSLTLDGDSNNTTNNSLLVVESGGVLTLDNQLKVQNAKTSQRGGGVYVHGGGTLTINNGVQFKDCSASQGANVYVESGATFNNGANIDKVHKENGGGSSSGFETDGDKGRVYLTVNTGAYAGLPSEPSVVRDRFIWNANENENDQCWGKAYAITRNPAEILNESILKSEYFIKDTASATWGVSDSTGEKTIGFLTEAAKTRLNTFLDKLATSNWADLDVLDQYGQKGKLTSSNVAQYELIPYVIKYQTEERAYDPVTGQWDQDANRIGWHIDCAVVPKARLQLNYALNLPDGVSTENPFALPTGKIGTGNSMTERVGSLCYNNSPVNVNGTVSASYDGKSGLYLKFTGWNTEADGTGTSYSPADSISITVDKTNSPVILYAQWVVTSPKYKVQWLDQNDKPLKDAETRCPTLAQLKAGKVSVEDADQADISGSNGVTYKFDSGNSKNVTEDNLDQNGSTVLKLYFKATVPTTPVKPLYLVKWLMKGEGGAEDTLVKSESRGPVEIGTEVSVTEKDKADFTTEDGKSYVFDSEAKGNVLKRTLAFPTEKNPDALLLKLYVKLKNESKSYTVEYYKDNVLVEGDTKTVTKTVASGTTTLDVEQTDETGFSTDKYVGYELSGIKVGETSYGENLPTTIAVNGTIEVYYTAIEYKIEYDLDGGTNDASNPAKYTVKDLPITLKAPSKEHGTFLGWTMGEGTSYVTGIPVGTIGNLKFTAHWQEDDKYTLTVNVVKDTDRNNPITSYTKTVSDLYSGAAYTFTKDDTATGIIVGNNNAITYPKFVTVGSDNYVYISGADNGSIGSENKTVTLIYTLDNWHDGEKDSTDDKKTGGDGIPDSQQILVEYVANGEGGTVSPDFEVITLANNQESVSLSGFAGTDNEHIFAGWKGDRNNFTSDKFNLAGEMLYKVQGGKTYTIKANWTKKAAYTLTVKAVIKKADGSLADTEFTQTVSDVMSGTVYSCVEGDNSITAAVNGQTKAYFAKAIPLDGENNYVYISGAESGTIDKANKVITLVYELDNWHDGEKDNTADSPTGGDGIPDSQQVLIDYKVAEDSTGKGTVAPEFEIITLEKNQTSVVPSGKATAGENSAFAYWTQGSSATPIYKVDLKVGTLTVEGGKSYIYTATFLEDKKGGGDNGESRDEIPDVWQAFVKYTVAQGQKDMGNVTIGDIAGITNVEKVGNNTLVYNLGVGVTSGTITRAGATAKTSDAGKYSFVSWTEPNNFSQTDASLEKGALDVLGGKTYTYTASWKKNGTSALTIKMVKETADGAQIGTVVTDSFYAGTAYSFTESEGASGVTGTNGAYTYPVKVTDGGDNYIYVSGADNGSIGSEDKTVTLVYTLDNWKDSDKTEDSTDTDSKTGGDGIPDKYQVVVKYVSANSDQGTVTAAEKVFTLTDAAGNYTDKGSVTPGIEGVQLKANTAGGYTFDKWDNDPDQAREVTGGEEYTYAAGWKKLTYTVTFNSNGGTDVAAQSVEHGKTAIQPVSPTRSGYTFIGWNLGSVAYDFSSPVTSSITLTAQWRQNNNGGNGGGNPPYIPDPTPTPTPRPTPRPTPIPDDPTPVDPGTSIDDEATPLAGAVGLNNVDHFAYIVGYDDNTVRPTNNITRAEVATIFFRLMEDDYRAANWATENSFSDVSTGQWYNNAISTCAKAGALTGYEDGSFRPENPITRAEFAVIASRFLGEEYTDEGVGDFSDTQGHWAAKEIRRAVKAGWITGDGNKFRPEDPITRAEVMTIVNRMLDRLPDAEHFLPDMIHWIDNPEGTWYYEAVQEATNEHAYERDELNAETWTQLLPARKWAELEKSWADAYAAG